MALSKEIDHISFYINELRRTIDASLNKATQFDDNCPNRLREAIRYCLLASGKRLRPILVMTANELCGGNRNEAIPAACAVEMIHAYSLIHDDLPAMDNDDLRRGQPTCHKKFDEATAILAGDALLAAAFESISNLSPSELIPLAVRELAVAAGACQLVGGQMDDILYENSDKTAIDNHCSANNNTKKEGEKSDATLHDLERIHHRKTGALIRVSLRLGGLTATATPQQITALDEFGTYFGLAFQITDDLLDILGDEKTVGKRLHKDCNKLTYPYFLGIEKSQKAAEHAIEKAEKILDIFEQETVSKMTLRFLLQNLMERRK